MQGVSDSGLLNAAASRTSAKRQKAYRLRKGQSLIDANRERMRLKRKGGTK
jgi:hypothetical protein